MFCPTLTAGVLLLQGVYVGAAALPISPTDRSRTLVITAYTPLAERGASPSTVFPPITINITTIPPGKHSAPPTAVLPPVTANVTSTGPLVERHPPHKTAWPPIVINITTTTSPPPAKRSVSPSSVWPPILINITTTTSPPPAKRTVSPSTVWPPTNNTITITSSPPPAKLSVSRKKWPILPTTTSPRGEEAAAATTDSATLTFTLQNDFTETVTPGQTIVRQLTGGNTLSPGGNTFGCSYELDMTVWRLNAPSPSPTPTPRAVVEERRAVDPRPRVTLGDDGSYTAANGTVIWTGRPVNSKLPVKSISLALMPGPVIFETDKTTTTTMRTKTTTATETVTKYVTVKD